MKTSHITSAFAAIGILTLASGCSLFNTNKSTGSNTASDAIKARTESSNSSTVGTDIVLPQDRENIAKTKEVRTYTPEEIAQGVVKGDWAIETINGRDAVGEKAPFLKFVPSEGRVYGNNGCNSLNGSYTYNPQDSTMSFGTLASTMMLCHKEGLTDYEINAALGATRRYTCTEKDSDYYLHLFDESGREIMTLMHQNFDFLNGSWRVSMIGDTQVTNPDVKLVIDVAEGKIHGNTGCNTLNGALEIDMNAANSISFSSIITTMRACITTPNYQTEFLVALEETSKAKPINPKEVLLFDSQDNQVLKLVREN